MYVEWSQGEVQAPAHMEPDGPHHDHPVVCIMTQHLLIITLLLPQKKIVLAFQNFIFQLFFAV
jgi:hypothetical protein